MSLPAGVSTFELLFGKTFDFEGTPLRTDLTITPSHELVWEATGDRLVPIKVSKDADEGEYGSVNLPHTDQAGFVDLAGNAITDWWYTVQSTDRKGRSSASSPKSRKLQVTSDVDTVDLDLIPINGSVGPVGSVPGPVVTSVNGLTGAVTVEGVTDESVTALFEDEGSAFRAASNATYGAFTLFTAVGGVGDGVTDNTAAFNAAMSAMAATGGTLFFPPGIYCIGGLTSHVPGGVTLEGTGFDFSDPLSTPPSKASVIRATDVMDRLIQLGETGQATTSAPGKPGASMRNLSVDGRDLAVTVVKTAARRNVIDSCQIYWGSSRGVWFAGQNSVLRGKFVVAQNLKGDCIMMDAYYDHKVTGNYSDIREWGPSGAGIRVSGVLDVVIEGNHIYTNTPASEGGTNTAAIVLETKPGKTTQLVNINDNIIESVAGPEILLMAGDSQQVRGVNINGNIFYNTIDATDNLYPVILCKGNGTGSGSITNLVIANNLADGAASNKRYSAFFELVPAGLAAFSRAMIDNNAGLYVASIIKGFNLWDVDKRPDLGMNAFQNGSANVRTSNQGSATFSGDGTNKVFNIPHGLDRAPLVMFAVAGSLQAASPSGGFMVGSDATNIIVTYNNAPAAGTNNVVLRWRAQL